LNTRNTMVAMVFGEGMDDSETRSKIGGGLTWSEHYLFHLNIRSDYSNNFRFEFLVNKIKKISSNNLIKQLLIQIRSC
jgi:hypothetical protein